MAEEFNHIDQIIRQKFENFEPEPPIQVWENIKAGIEKNPPAPSSPGILLPIIISVSLLLFISGLLHQYYNGNDLESSENSGLSIQSASVISTGSTTISDPALQHDFYSTPSEFSVPEIVTGTKEETRKDEIPVRMPFEQKPTVKDKKQKARQNTSVGSTGTPIRGQWKPGLVQALVSGELSYADALKYDLSPRDIRKLSGYSDYARKNVAEWSVGFYFNPEVSNFKDNSFDNTVSYNIGLLPRVNFNRFFIQSGINMRFTHDKGNYSVDYNRYLGTYEDVYLVTFDSTENGIIPTYYTQTVEVYDTVNHYAISETKAKYTYFEIPLLLGYRHTFGKFSLFAKAGPAASFLVIKNVPDAANPEDKAKVINVDYQIPVRSAINWQLMMGAGFDYMLADRFSFSLEPTFRFALKPEYKLTEGAKGNTASFGIRAGLNYNF